MSATVEGELYCRWSAARSTDVAGDPLGRMAVYRLSLFVMDIAWDDATLLDRGITRQVAPQLYRSVSSISANIADGYGRLSGRDRRASMSTRCARPERRSFGAGLGVENWVRT
jgi:hypothetical protein